VKNICLALTEPQARIRVLHLEAKPTRAAAIKLYLAVDRNWRSSGALHDRLSSIISSPLLLDRPSSTRIGGTDLRVSITIDTTDLPAEPGLASGSAVAEQWDTHTCAQKELHIIHYKAGQLAVWWQ